MAGETHLHTVTDGGLWQWFLIFVMSIYIVTSRTRLTNQGDCSNLKNGRIPEDEGEDLSIDPLGRYSSVSTPERRSIIVVRRIQFAC
jgi:hypothetical protein